MSAHQLENEVKIRLSPMEAFPEALFAAGFQESAPRTFESNTLYDTPDYQLRAAENLLRVRETDCPGQGKAALLTWKGKGTAGPHKNRPEAETRVESAAVLQRILLALGFVPVFRYEKFRTEYRRDDLGVVVLDETPIGRFLELEGPPDWIDETALLLGIGSDRYVLESYGRLYQLDCQARHVQPGDMVFSDHS